MPPPTEPRRPAPKAVAINCHAQNRAKRLAPMRRSTSRSSLAAEQTFELYQSAHRRASNVSRDCAMSIAVYQRQRQLFDEAFELVEARVANDELARLPLRALTAHRRAELSATLLQAGATSRSGCLALCAPSGCARATCASRFGLAHRQALPAMRWRASICWPRAPAARAHGPCRARPSSSIVCTGSASSSRRSRLVTALRERPIASAACSCGQRNSSISRLTPARFLQRIQVLALDVLDQRHAPAPARRARRARPPAPRPARRSARPASGARRR